MTNEYYENLPTKRIGSGVLFLNKDNKCLLVKPNYRDHWGIVGGVVDAGESPVAAAIREVKEEIGLKIENPRFLCVYWYPKGMEKTEAIQFIFYGGKLSEDQIDSIKLDNTELLEYKFFTIDEAYSLLPHVAPGLMKKSYESILNNSSFYGEGK
jgi:ADP-ribose pyrophosphatase YjhB (NUDIX family)